MEARAFARRVVFGLMAAVCAVVLLATAAMGYVRRSPTYSGVWQDWGDNVWEYYYFAPTDCEYWRFKSNQQVRFAYKCTPGQWWQYTSTHGGFSPIGLGSVGNDFLGDDHNWHVVANTTTQHWAFQYWWDQDCAYWLDTTENETRFAYKYGPGQWWDYTTPNNSSWTGWGHLGIGPLATAAFIGDGEWHTFDTAKMTGGSYFWSTADAEFRYYGGAYYWRCAGIERYKFVYGAGYTGSWFYGDNGSWYSLGSWENTDVRYEGGGCFIQSGLIWDPGTNRPSGVPSPRYIQYSAFYVGGGVWDFWCGWKINNPGSDNKWSGGILNVLWCHNDFNAGYAEYTKDDVVVFVMDMDSAAFANVVNAMTLVRDYFRSQISTVMVCAHGNSTGWQVGQWMDTSNYTTFQSDWVRWGNLMTADGQIVAINCEVGQASTMLNAIAAWSGIDIFANTNTTYTRWYWITSNQQIDTSVWNQNQQRVTWVDIENGAWDGSNRFFEFTTTGSQNYRWILYY